MTAYFTAWPFTIENDHTIIITVETDNYTFTKPVTIHKDGGFNFYEGKVSTLTINFDGITGDEKAPAPLPVDDETKTGIFVVGFDGNMMISGDIKNALPSKKIKAVTENGKVQIGEEDLASAWKFEFNPKSFTYKISSVLDLRENPGFNRQQKRQLNKASHFNPGIKETSMASELMPILQECLRQRHDATPVHSESELQTLKDRFPKGIRLFLAGTGTQPEAAVCIYDTNSVAHCQYIATSEQGRENGVLTYLMHHLINEVFTENRYFDFGTSNEDAGRLLNSGLLHQKTGLGGRGVAYQIFSLKL